MTTIQRMPDIGYLAVVTLGTQNDYYVDFKAYKADFTDGEIWLEEKDGPGGLCADVPIEKAQVFVSGSIKWDGCANFQFDGQETCMLHTCSREDLINIGVLLGRIHEIAETLIPHWDG